MNQIQVNLVAYAAWKRGDPVVPWQFIKEALEQIDRGEQDVAKDPLSGIPTFEGVYQVATMLWGKSQTKH